MPAVKCRPHSPVYVVKGHIDVNRNEEFMSIRGSVNVDVAALRRIVEHYTAVVPHVECCLRSKAARHLRDMTDEVRGVAETMEDAFGTQMHAMCKELSFLRKVVAQYDAHFGPDRETPAELHARLQRLQRENAALRKRAAQADAARTQLAADAQRQVRDHALHARAAVIEAGAHVVLPPAPETRTEHPHVISVARPTPIAAIGGAMRDPVAASVQLQGEEEDAGPTQEKDTAAPTEEADHLCRRQEAGGKVQRRVRVAHPVGFSDDAGVGAVVDSGGDGDGDGGGGGVQVQGGALWAEGCDVEKDVVGKLQKQTGQTEQTAQMLTKELRIAHKKRVFIPATQHRGAIKVEDTRRGFVSVGVEVDEVHIQRSPARLRAWCADTSDTLPGTSIAALRAKNKALLAERVLLP